VVVSDAYEHSGVPDTAGLSAARVDLWQDMPPGPHAFADNKAHEFFRKYL
jgi:hypothetical protein